MGFVELRPEFAADGGLGTRLAHELENHVPNGFHSLAEAKFFKQTKKIWAQVHIWSFVGGRLIQVNPTG